MRSERYVIADATRFGNQRMSELQGHGTSPIGGKTIFPANWSLPKIKNAVLSALRDPQAMVLRSTTKNGKPLFYIRGTVEGVMIDVGITGNRVGTAFPSWRQGYPSTIAEAYLSWWSNYDRVRESGDFLNSRELIATDLDLRTQMLAVYLGKEPEGISSSEYQTLRLYLDPAQLQDSPEPILARAFQGVIFDWLRHEQMVRDLENDPGPYR